MATAIASSDIAAEAFGLLRMGPIDSYGEGTPEAEDGQRSYDRARRSTLDRVDWAFASAFADLPATVVTPAIEDWPNTYTLPAECIRLRDVLADGAQWRLDGITLRSDAGPPLRVRFTRDIVDEGLIPDAVKSAIAARMALLMAPRWITSAADQARLREHDRDVWEAAVRVEARMHSGRRADGLPRQGDWRSEVLA